MHVLHPDERIVGVRGRQSTMGYLCGALTFVLSSGRELAFTGENPNVFGDAFEFAVPDIVEIIPVSLVSRGRIPVSPPYATLTNLKPDFDEIT